MSRFLCFLLIFIVLTGCSDRNVYVADEDLVLTCDAEKMEGDKLVAGDYLLDHGYTQSTDKARSGSHSVKLNNENQYGFSLEIQDVKKGDAILISVWRSMADASGTIVEQNWTRRMHSFNKAI